MPGDDKAARRRVAKRVEESCGHRFGK